MTDRLSRRSVLGVMALAGGAALVGRPTAQAQTGNLLERLRTAKMAKVAIAAQPPYSELMPDGTLGGIGPAVAKAAMDKLGVPKLEAVVVPYGDMIPGLMAGRWDFISACLTITAARCKQVSFGPPIVFDPAAGAYVNEIKDHPTTFAELVKRPIKIGVIAGYISAHLRTIGIADDRMLIFPDTNALIDGLGAGRIELAVAANSGLATVQKQSQVKFTLKLFTDSVSAGSGPAFRQTDTELFEAYQKEVMAMKASGEIARLNAQFGFVYDRSQHDTVTQKEACQWAV